MENIKQFARYFRPYKVQVFVGVFFILASTVFSLLTPYFVGQAVDVLSDAKNLTWSQVLFFPLAILGANAVSGVLLFWQRRLIINMSRDIEFDMRRELYAHLVDQPLEFFQNNRVGDLMARATNDLSAVRQIMGPMILYTCQAIFVVLLALPLLLSISPFLTALP